MRGRGGGFGVGRGVCWGGVWGMMMVCGLVNGGGGLRRCCVICGSNGAVVVLYGRNARVKERVRRLEMTRPLRWLKSRLLNVV